MQPIRLIFAVTLVSASALVASANDDTIVVIEEGAMPEDIVNVIPLPARPSMELHKRGNSTPFDDAESLIHGREFGQDRAEEARNMQRSARDHRMAAPETERGPPPDRGRGRN